MLDLAIDESDKSLEKELIQELADIKSKATELEIATLFSGDLDDNNCFLEINAGAGGTESHDWVSMIMRMYMRFAQNMNFQVKIIDILPGEEAGIKSCTIKIKGHQAYGWLRTESGVHRLVRISPFNSVGKRMTSFASCCVLPEINDDIDIDIQDKDLKIATYRASGAGGQHVNTTDSAVRITHIPSKIVVQCQNNRSQHKNKEEAIKMLKSKLYENEIAKRKESAQQEYDQKTDIGFGYQIRSYVLQPYQMVKDLRTNYETSNTKAVLDGDLKEFIYSNLKNLCLNKNTT